MLRSHISRIGVRAALGVVAVGLPYACARGVDLPLDEAGAGGSNPITGAAGTAVTVGTAGSPSATGSGGAATGSGGAATGSGGGTTTGGGTPSATGGNAGVATSTGAAGTTGTAGTGGAGGAGGAGGSGGTSGASGAGGSSGASGSGGTGGSGGTSGASGAGGGGKAGAGGAGGASGNGGAGGAGGSPPRPTGITLNPVSTPSGQRAPSVGGGAFSQTCATNEVLIGYTGTVDAPDASTNYLRSFQAICGSLSITGTTTFSVRTTQAEPLPVRGMASVTAQTRMCAANQVIVGFGGRSGGYIDQLAFVCAPLTISGTSPNFTLSIGAQTTLTGLGGPGGSPFTAMPCPGGMVAVGDEGRDGQAIDSFGLLCSTPTLVVQ
jgi:hypothetical protein